MFITGWVLLSLLFAPEVYLFFIFQRMPIPWTQTLSLTAINAAVVLVFLPFIVWLTRRYPIERQTWRKALLFHLPACLAFAAGHSALYGLVCLSQPGFVSVPLVRLHPNLLTYWAIVGFTQAMDYFRRYREREQQLAQVQLLLLKSQLHPHFLFNTLNTVSAMMHEDVRAADRMVNKLSDLLRMTLETVGTHEVRLRQELDFLKKYLEIEQARFPDAFQLRLEVEPSALDAFVPSMLLQPLIENSIRHGFAASKKNGVILVRASREGEKLVLRVVDDGCGLPHAAPKPSAEGLGLAITRKRLEQLYPGSHHFELSNSSSTAGAVATIAIPFHNVPAEAMATPELAAG
ncbi:MAG: histidine kinase [Acidobacteria bacterium]|nr:histidine kinase [Acidobacteriota bacterium]